MSEDSKVNTGVDTTFAQPVPEKTELERLQERIANFKVSVTPAVAQFSQILMQQSLQNPTKIEDLDAFVQIRNELKTGMDEYTQQVEQANRRIAQLTEEHNIQKQTELARREQDLKDARDAERKRRKDAESEIRTLESILKSHGINIDLDGDGKVGLNTGEEAQPLSTEKQATLKKLLDESASATGVGSVGTSRAFEAARALNPVNNPNATVVQKGSEQDEWANEASKVEDSGISTQGELFLEVPEDAQGTAEFYEEVEETASVYDTPGYDDPVTPDYGSKPVISDTNSPSIIEDELAKVPQSETHGTIDKTESEKMQDELEPIVSPSVRMVEEDDIADFDNPPAPEEEETVEVVIPTESELKAMTKSKIKREAESLGFQGITTRDPKATMIENFLAATQGFINDLQDSGEFVSATDSEEGNEDSSNDRDGGYFKS